MTLDEDDIALIAGMIAARGPTADDIATMQQVAEAVHQPVALDGTIVTGSWDPADGTVEVELGDTAALPVEDGSGPLSHPRLPLHTRMVGEQTAPLGGERCVIIPRQSGWIVVIEDGTDGVPKPGAAPGESVKLHRPSGAVIALRNDDAPGDRAGAYHIDGLARHRFATKGGVVREASDATTSVADTAGPASTTLDGVAQTITHAVGTAQAKLDAQAKTITHTVGTATAKLDALAKKITHAVDDAQVIVDGAGKTIAVIPGAAGKIGLGALPGALAAVRGVAAAADLSTLEDRLRTQTRLDMILHTQTLAPFLNNGAGAVAAVQGLAALVHVQIPGCSGTVFASP